LDDVLSIYHGAAFISIEQFPGFSLAAEPGQTVLYFLAYKQNELRGYACVNIKKRMLATVMFGPVVKYANEYEEICKGLISKCTGKAIFMLRILPPYMADQDRSAIDSTKAFKYEHSTDETNWSSVRLPLDKPMEEILKSFSENHRRSIKKAQKLNLKADKIDDIGDINVFSEQYIQMYQSRGLAVSLDAIRSTFRNLFLLFNRYDNGLFIAVKTDEQAIIGGVCIAYQGNTAFYYKGYSHPDHRNLPVNHLGFYEAMSIAKDRGLKYFDFGGYAIDAKEGDQLYAINRFKDGFGGEIITHPRTMVVFMMPFAKFFYKLYRRQKVSI
jgi:hypothetical protein